jgi:hypothetical protein
MKNAFRLLPLLTVALGSSVASSALAQEVRMGGPAEGGGRGGGVQMMQLVPVTPDGGGPGGASGGGSGGQYVLENADVPQAHTVKRGDTLWSISGQYFRNPYQWPKLWSVNPQVQNPHWIYPGDRVRLKDSGLGSSADAARPLRPRTVPETTVFIREYGWVDDPEQGDLGGIVGSPRESMMLSTEDDVYVEFTEDAKVELGKQFTLWKEIRTLRGREAEASGELVKVFGTVRVDRYNPKTRMARARILESLDVIERGLRVGEVNRDFLIVPPKRNEQYSEARILTALLPFAFFGQHQILFLDRGKKDGVQPGNRFFAVERGDRWVNSLGTAGPQASTLPSVEDDRDAVMEDMNTGASSDRFPNETTAEVRVLAVREETCLAIVMESAVELERDAVLVMKKGL